MPHFTHLQLYWSSKLSWAVVEVSAHLQCYQQTWNSCSVFGMLFHTSAYLHCSVQGTIHWQHLGNYGAVLKKKEVTQNCFCTTLLRWGICSHERKFSLLEMNHKSKYEYLKIDPRPTNWHVLGWLESIRVHPHLIKLHWLTPELP